MYPNSLTALTEIWKISSVRMHHLNKTPFWEIGPCTFNIDRLTCWLNNHLVEWEKNVLHVKKQNKQNKKTYMLDYFTGDAMYNESDHRDIFRTCKALQRPSLTKNVKSLSLKKNLDIFIIINVCWRWHDLMETISKHFYVTTNYKHILINDLS